MKFIEEYLSGSWTVVDLARRHGISRKTAYKLIGRFREEGAAGLTDKSRARHRQDGRTPAAIERRVIAMKRRYPTWGPRKVLARLERTDPDTCWPARSTVGDILLRAGLVTPRKTRRRVPPSSGPLAAASEPNDVWCTDFKGHRLSGLDERLEPFTLGDAFSRYSLSCTLVESTAFESVWPHFEGAFREYGLPRRMRSDNGPPFATRGLGGLSALSVRFIRLGIRPERITPGKPQQNGMLERFHLTLQLDAMSPPGVTIAAQQRKLDAFRACFNGERPHEALDDRTPADVYETSPRRFPETLPEHEYPRHVPTRSVRSDGSVRWDGEAYFLSETLAGERVGFQQCSEDRWAIRFGPVEVALFDERSRQLLRHDRLIWDDDTADA